MKEWYLTSPTPNITSGYESDIISEYAQSNFTDILETTFSDAVLLYNSSLTEFQKVRCVVQDNMASTQLKSIERTILFPIGTAKAGMYVFFEDRYWIIDGYPGNNKSYEKVTAKLCQYNLTWQLADGNIIKRWVSLASASKYDVGESDGSVIILSSNNYTMLIGYDADAMELEGKRVFIDKRETNPTKVFKLTRNDDVLYEYGLHGSLLSFICDKNQLDRNKDNQELRICDYFFPITENEASTDLTVTISGNDELKIGLSRIYTAVFTDDDGNEVTDTEFTWNIVSSFEVTYSINGNEIGLCASDEDTIGESFVLQILSVNGIVMTEMTIIVTDAF